MKKKHDLAGCGAAGNSVPFLPLLFSCSYFRRPLLVNTYILWKSIYVQSVTGMCMHSFQWVHNSNVSDVIKCGCANADIDL